MEIPPRRYPLPRVPFRLQAWVALISVPFLYLFFRYAAHIPPQTAGEQIFLGCYAILCAANFALAVGSRPWMTRHAPAWCENKAVRWGVYVAVALALSFAVCALPLPPFYVQVAQHSIIIFLVPYFIGYPQDAMGSGLLRRPSKPVPTGAGDLVLRANRRTGVMLLIGSLVFVTSVLLLPKLNPVIFWMTIIFFGLGALASLLMLWPGFIQLELRREDFVIVNMGRRRAYRWDEVCNFTVVGTQTGSRVAWDFRPESPRPRSKLLQDMYGKNMILIQDYGVAPEELCRLMNERCSGGLYPPILVVT